MSIHEGKGILCFLHEMWTANTEIRREVILQLYFIYANI